MRVNETILKAFAFSLASLWLASCGAKKAAAPAKPTTAEKPAIEAGSTGDDGSDSGSSSAVASGSGSGVGTGTGTGTDDETVGSGDNVTISTQLVGGSQMQVKNVEFLRRSMAECLGTELNNKAIFALANDAKIGNPTADAKYGKVQFYNGICPIGGDILNCLSSDLYDPNLIAGDTVSSNALQVNYLQALGTVANVVAHNCDLANPSSSCMCDDDLVAATLVKNCLPSLETKDAANASAFLAQTCRTDSTDQGQQNKARRQGIANLLGSVAFAKSRE